MFTHSIRWRLQLWHSCLLLAVLSGFGLTAWELQRSAQYRRLDEDLQRRVAVVNGALRRSAGERPPPGRPPRDRMPGRDDLRGPPPAEDRPAGAAQGLRDFRFTPQERTWFEGESARGFYYLVWAWDGRVVASSPDAPGEVPVPEGLPGLGGQRSRGAWREAFHVTPPGDCILVGRDARAEQAALRRLGWVLAAVGVGILALGVAGGWWVTNRALQPVAEIGATAVKIADGNLAERIQVGDERSELGQLAQVLNRTFDRLQAAFGRQIRFTGDASHELRTPTAVILTHTQSALSRERSGAEYRESLGACQRAAQRMRGLIESLLVLARLDAGDAVPSPEPFRMDGVARESVELLRALAEGQQVTLQCQLEEVACRGNAEQWGQVVTNLVSNAICYNRPGGVVVVEVGPCPDGARLVVRDSGSGIGPEDLPHIFERFYRADKARSQAQGRTGLGLAIVQSIVTAHGGTVRVSSTPGQGSEFVVELPGSGAADP
jgi:heavy metal sensor kinase